MRVIDLEMIKGVRRVEADYSGWTVTLWVSPWVMWSKRRRRLLNETLGYRTTAGVYYKLRTWWW